MKTAASLPALLALACSAAAQTPQVAIRVAPAYIETAVERGKQYDFDVSLGNSGSQTVTLDAAAAGLELTPDGLPVIAADGRGSHSCAPWLTLEPERLSLEPGQVASVRASLRVPTDARGGLYGAIAFRVPLGAVTRGSEASKLLVQSVTGCVLMLTVSGPATVRAEAKEPQAAVDAQTGLATFTFPVQNTGEIHVKCNGQAVVFGPDGRVAARLPLDVGTGTILPGGIRSLTASWRLPKSPEPGEYRVQGRVSVPGSRSLRAQCTFRLP